MAKAWGHSRGAAAWPEVSHGGICLFCCHRNWTQSFSIEDVVVPECGKVCVQGVVRACTETVSEADAGVCRALATKRSLR